MVRRNCRPRHVEMREAAYDWELGSGLEQAVLQLPEDYRLVLILHDVEEMSTNETVSAATSVRLHRACAALRRHLYARAGASSVQAFQFHAERCDRVVKNVFKSLSLPE
jgi:RNA polymerase sigma-70 factor (ECF subfamily)